MQWCLVFGMIVLNNMGVPEEKYLRIPMETGQQCLDLGRELKDVVWEYEIKVTNTWLACFPPRRFKEHCITNKEK